METLRGILTAQGLRCLITNQIRHRSNAPNKDVIGDLFEVFDRVDDESDARHSGRLLWVFRNPEQEEQIRKAVDRQVEVGMLLGYPACCVEQHETVGSNFSLNYRPSGLVA